MAMAGLLVLLCLTICINQTLQLGYYWPPNQEGLGSVILVPQHPSHGDTHSVNCHEHKKHKKESSSSESSSSSSSSSSESEESKDKEESEEKKRDEESEEKKGEEEHESKEESKGSEEKSGSKEMKEIKEIKEIIHELEEDLKEKEPEIEEDKKESEEAEALEDKKESEEKKESKESEESKEKSKKDEKKKKKHKKHHHHDHPTHHRFTGFPPRNSIPYAMDYKTGYFKGYSEPSRYYTYNSPIGYSGSPYPPINSGKSSDYVLSPMVKGGSVPLPVGRNFDWTKPGVANYWRRGDNGNVRYTLL